uniref:RNA-directed RNA polymerase n=1 Tax=Diaporthe helianthi umbravirus 1 TaxID=3077439 RepID=A0AA96H9U8_9TOMB|nr:MAG: RNA-dependent RNA polymerase [Diaporthe helianthi umbravirus 1]
MYRAYVPAEEGVWAPACYANCRENELAALKLRTMGPTPDDPLEWPASVGRAFAGLRRLARVVCVDKWDVWQTAQSYSGRLRRRYLEAARSLETDGWISKDDYRLSAFLKGEKHNPRLKRGKPRMICPRSPRYNLVLASYLKPLEHALWKRWRFGLGVLPTRVSAKGLNSEARARLIERKMESVGDCVVFEVDGKAFEAHVTGYQLDLEAAVYKAAYPGDRELAGLLSVQRKLVGKTAGGIRFSRVGARASGDFNTGMGNTLLMGGFVTAALSDFAASRPDLRCTILVDGDNALLFVSANYASSLHQLFPELVRSVSAHEMAVEKPTTVIERVIFGQSQPVRTAGGLRMVRNVWKTLSGAFCGHRHYHDRAFAPRLMHEIALAELALSKGVPVLQPYFKACVDALAGYKRVRDPSAFLEGHLLGVTTDGKVGEITLDARLSFEQAFGISVEDQLGLEARLVSGVRHDMGRVVRDAQWLRVVVECYDGRDADETDDHWDQLYLPAPEMGSFGAATDAGT